MQRKLETRVGIFVLAALGVFVYLGFRVGTFRLDRRNYYGYYLACHDIEGLSSKADVKIAGVKVGWVELIALRHQEPYSAHAQIMIGKEFKLYRNAYAVIRQEGILGPKYVEIVPGDSQHAQLVPDEYIGKSLYPSSSVDEMLKQMQQIMVNVGEVTGSIKELVSSVTGRDQIKSILSSLQITTEKMALFSTWFDQLDRDNHLENILQCSTRVQQVADQVSQNLTVVNTIAHKVDSGCGTIGKLINDDQTYRDVEYVVHGLKNYFSKLAKITFIFDSHVEGMLRPAENYRFEDSKGYFNIRVYPSEDYFYLFQLAASEKGFAYRKQIDRLYCDEHGNLVDTQALLLPDWARLAFVFNENKDVYRRNTLKFGLQFGKIFRDVALRFGIFEGTAGAAIDIDIPLRTDYLRWVTSFEIFDMRGWNRKDDRRAHVKWLNRMYILRNIYTTFGADDFISKHNANVFFGIGVRFGDDDVKYLLSTI